MSGQSNHPGGTLTRSAGPAALALAVLTVALAAGTGAGQEQPPAVYVAEDALLAGREMHSFSSDGRTVNVVLGDFSLTVGKHVVSGRDAVIWIEEQRLGAQVRRDIELYVEGKARAVGPEGAVTTDEKMLVTLHQQGQLRAKVGKAAEGPVDVLPVYLRAVEQRRQAAALPAVKPAPAILVRQDPPDSAPANPPGPKPKARAAPATTSAPAEEAPAYQPVTFRANSVTSEEIPDPMDPKRKLRITIAQGDVYLSQGSREEARFMELRAQAAVVYTMPDAKAPGPVPERIIGVYLENDVVMRRGERTVTGPRLFYDFQTGKALIVEPVLRTVQEQRNIPVYIRAREGRQLEARTGKGGLAVAGNAWVFQDALVTTSDFYTPAYSISARKVFMEDLTPYDEQGEPLAPPTYRTRMVNTTFNLGAVPVLWWPYSEVEGEQGHTALRRVTINREREFGWGITTSWFLFRLLGVQPPPGVDGRLELDYWERGFVVGPRIEYNKENYSGIVWGSYVNDRTGEDNFGTERVFDANRNRGRFLFRHKHFLPKDWEVQLETSYLSDRGFLEKFYPGEFFTGKEQETLIYAKKQRDNWAFTALGQWRMNDFLTQTESYPDLAGYLVGQSLWNDRLTLYSEAHAGVVRFRPDDRSELRSSSAVGRVDTRQEIDAPLGIGPVKLVPFAAGRLSYWCQTPLEGGPEVRAWGQLGLNATTHIWRIYDQAASRLWDIHKIKHIITPYGGLFFADTNLPPARMFPFSPDIEQYVRRLGGGTLGVLQVFQTKRGPVEDQRTVDWLRFNLAGAFFDDAHTRLPADGRYYWFRPEYSLPRNSINADLAWLISDATTLLADANFDTDTCDLGRGDIGIAFSRDPRLRYYIGSRYIRDLHSHVGTYGLRYQISRKYQLTFFEQYDWQLDGGRNQVTSVTLMRKFPRLYVALTFTYSRVTGDVAMALSLWPEGVPEARFGGTRFGLLNAFGPEDW